MKIFLQSSGWNAERQESVPGVQQTEIDCIFSLSQQICAWFALGGQQFPCYHLGLFCLSLLHVSIFMYFSVTPISVLFLSKQIKLKPAPLIIKSELGNAVLVILW